MNNIPKELTEDEKKKDCPVCGNPARYAGLRTRGVPLHYYQAHTWFCSRDWLCNYAGFPIWEEDTPDSEEVQKLAERRAKEYETVWWRREARQRALNGEKA